MSRRVGSEGGPRSDVGSLTDKNFINVSFDRIILVDVDETISFTRGSFEPLSDLTCSGRSAVCTLVGVKGLGRMSMIWT